MHVISLPQKERLLSTWQPKASSKNFNPLLFLLLESQLPVFEHIIESIPFQCKNMHDMSLVTIDSDHRFLYFLR